MKDIAEFLDGKTLVRRGIRGKFKLEIYRAIYPYEHTYTQLWHIPDEQGRQTEEYREIKRQLGDDWQTDLTNEFDAQIEAAAELGYFDQPAEEGATR